MLSDSECSGDVGGFVRRHTLCNMRRGWGTRSSVRGFVAGDACRVFRERRFRFAAQDVGDDDALGRIVPLAVGVEAGGVGAGGGHDGGGSGSDVAGLFENVLEGEAKIASADFVESDGVSVAIDGDPGDAEAVGGFVAGVFGVVGELVDEIGSLVSILGFAHYI